MQLIGMLDSPYVRRAAISLRMLGLPFTHQSLSVFSTFEAFQAINPVVKAPTLILDDGEQLIDSSLIIDYAEQLAEPGRSLMPVAPKARFRVLQLCGLALAACEKTVQIIYEHNLRPAEKRHAPWLERVEGQLHAAYRQLEAKTAGADSWLSGDCVTQADITVAVSWRFTQLFLPETVHAADYPALTELSAQAEQLPEFLTLPPN